MGEFGRPAIRLKDGSSIADSSINGVWNVEGNQIRFTKHKRKIN